MIGFQIRPRPPGFALQIEGSFFAGALRPAEMPL